jgi:hypothetical protein
MMCAATVNWTLFTDMMFPVKYVVIIVTIGCTLIQKNRPRCLVLLFLMFLVQSCDVRRGPLERFTCMIRTFKFFANERQSGSGPQLLPIGQAAHTGSVFGV